MTIKTFLRFFIIGLLGLVCGVAVAFSYGAIATSGVFATAQKSAVAAPARLIIPSIHIDAPIKPVGVDAKGNLGVPADAAHVAWYKNGPRPGMPGAAVMDGHLDTKTAPQAVFYNLDKLKPNDEVDVRTLDGRTIIFKVVSVQKYAYDASDASIRGIFISSSTVPELNLITCAGDWVPEKKVYDQRLVVFAIEAGVSSGSIITL